MGSLTYRKYFFSIILLSACMVAYAHLDGCDVLPKNAKQRIFLNNELYALTPHGLKEIGQVIDQSVWQGDMKAPCFHGKSETLYFASHRYLVDEREDESGIYQISLSNGKKNFNPFKLTVGGGAPAISPNGQFLAFERLEHELVILNLQTKKQYRVLSDLQYGPVVWVDDDKFLYAAMPKMRGGSLYSLWRHSDTKLILFDLKNRRGVDLNMGGYFPCLYLTRTQDVLLTNYHKVVKYNLASREQKILLDSKYPLTSQIIVWLPRLDGFLYTRHTPENNRNYNEFGDLFFYSLSRKKEVDLLKVFDLTGGFVVSSDSNLKPVVNQYNRVLPMQKRIRVICVGKKDK